MGIMEGTASAVRVRLHDAEYLLFGDLATDGSISTADDFRAGRASFAHLFQDGFVRRFGKVIAERADLEVLGEAQVDFDPVETLVGCLTDPSWAEEEVEDA